MPTRSIADQWLEEAREEMAREAAAEAKQRAGMSPDQLLQLERQIAEAKRRGNEGENVRERLRGLRQAHFRGNGSDGG